MVVFGEEGQCSEMLIELLMIDGDCVLNFGDYYIYQLILMFKWLLQWIQFMVYDLIGGDVFVVVLVIDLGSNC